MYQWNTVARAVDDLKTVGKSLTRADIDKVVVGTTIRLVRWRGVRLRGHLTSFDRAILSVLLGSSLEGIGNQAGGRSGVFRSSGTTVIAVVIVVASIILAAARQSGRSGGG